MNNWVNTFDQLPRCGSSIEIRVGADPDADSGVLTSYIKKITGTPELGEPWLFEAGLYIVQWRYMQ